MYHVVERVAGETLCCVSCLNEVPNVGGCHVHWNCEVDESG